MCEVRALPSGSTRAGGRGRQERVAEIRLVGAEGQTLDCRLWCDVQAGPTLIAVSIRSTLAWC